MPGGNPTHPAQGHDGLFGPGSVTWRVMDDPLMWVAAYRAAYLQALHPRVMRGTWQHSALARPKQLWGRLIRTAEFVRVRTYGSHTEVNAAGERVRRLHASLWATGPGGTRYRLDEPELLLWVHCCEIGSYLEIARRSGLPLSRADADTFVDEGRRGAAVIGLDPATVPATAAALDTYFASMRPGLAAIPEARQVLLRSASPRVPLRYTPLRAAAPGLAGLGFATLPRWARRLYGTPATPVADLAATVALRLLRAGGARLPGQVYALLIPATLAAHAHPAVAA